MPAARERTGGAVWCSALCALLLTAPASRSMANPAAARPRQQVDRRVIAALPTLNGKSAKIVGHLDLTRPFHLRTPWTFVAATLTAARFSAADARTVHAGPLALCFVDQLAPRCRYTLPRTASSQTWFSTPVHFYSAKIVFAGAGHTDPLLLIRSGSAYAIDGGHTIFTQLFRYDRRSNGFTSVFAHATASNNNQETRFVAGGPLRGDVIVAVPTDGPPYVYWIRVYAPKVPGRQLHLVLRYRSLTGYGDGNPLAVIDSEMPNILRRLGKWRPGQALPVPPRLPADCKPRFYLVRGEEWCVRKKIIFTG